MMGYEHVTLEQAASRSTDWRKRLSVNDPKRYEDLGRKDRKRDGYYSKKTKSNEAREKMENRRVAVRLAMQRYRHQKHVERMSVSATRETVQVSYTGLSIIVTVHIHCYTSFIITKDTALKSF